MASEPQVPVPLTPLLARRWSVAQWHRHAAEWQDLMARSQADPLFLSFEWLSSWWSCFGDSLGQSPEVLAFYRGTQLAGLAPLYRQRVLRNGFLPAQSVQMMGLAWRDPEPLISEYLDVIGAEADLGLLREACVQQLLQDPAWSEFVIGFTASGTKWREAYQRCAGSDRHYVRELDRSVAYQAHLSDGFAVYLAGLEQSTRRSLWNLRHRLGGAGQVLLEGVPQEGIGRAFQDLNRLHQLRWQRPAFTGRRLRFHTTLNWPRAGNWRCRGCTWQGRWFRCCTTSARVSASTTSRWPSIRPSAAVCPSGSYILAMRWKPRATAG